MARSRGAALQLAIWVAAALLGVHGRELHHAAERGDLDVVARALESGEDPQSRDQDGYTLLHLAAGRKLALASRCVLYRCVGGRFEAGSRLLIVGMGHASMVSLLIEYGASPSVGDEHGETPLHLAAAVGHEEVVRNLLAGGADVNQQSQNGCVANLWY